MVPRPRALLPLLAVAVLAGCGGSSSSTGASAPSGASTSSGPSPSPGGANAADAAFVRHMLVHHRRALAVGALMSARGSDPRVRAFGARITREQTPEERRLASWATRLHVVPRSTDAAMADGYVTDAALAALKASAGRAFDLAALRDSASSESGAAAMAGRELAAGTYAPARALARSIATAPGGEIPQLRALAAALPR